MTKRYRAALVGVLLAFPVAAAAAEAQYEWKGGKWVRAAEPAEGTPGGELALIRKYIDNRQDKQALQAAENFLKKYRDDPACEEVFLLAGQAELDAGRCYQAYEWFERQLKQYPGGALSERAMNRELEVAEAFLRGKKRIVAKVIRLPAEDEGLDILSRVAEHAPGSAIAEKALMRIADHQYSCKRWAEAAKAYDRFLELFGKSGDAPYAMLQAARATYADFKGISYDETPLLEARQRFETFQERYPRAAQKADVPAILESITATRAEAAYATGEFYKRTGKPSATLYYFRHVIDQYPDTDSAGRARQALDMPARAKPSRAAAPGDEDIFAEPQPAPKAPGDAAGTPAKGPSPGAQEGKAKQ